MSLRSEYDTWHQRIHEADPSHQPFDRRQWFPQIRKCVHQAGWTILRTDGTVHQFPFVPGHNPICWEALEGNRAVRKLLSPFALSYFIVAEKPVRSMN